MRRNISWTSSEMTLLVQRLEILSDAMGGLVPEMVHNHTVGGPLISFLHVVNQELEKLLLFGCEFPPAHNIDDNEFIDERPAAVG